jgi:hypothetical protein
MLNILRVEEARLQLSLFQFEPSIETLEPVQLAAGLYRPQLNGLVYLRAKVTNLSRELVGRNFHTCSNYRQYPSFVTNIHVQFAYGSSPTRSLRRLIIRDTCRTSG